MNSVSASHYIINNNDEYRYYRFVYVSNNKNDIGFAYGVKFQLYGAPDYDSRTYIYDHGVEVMPVTSPESPATYGSTEKRNDYLYLKAASSGTPNGTVMAQFYAGPLNVNSHSIVSLSLGKLLNVGASTRFGSLALRKSVPYVSHEDTDTISSLSFNLSQLLIDINDINDNVYVVIFANNHGAEGSVETLWLE